MQQIAEMTVRDFRWLKRIATIVKVFMPNPYDYYYYSTDHPVIAETGCSVCGYSLVKCSLTALVCEECEESHVMCASSGAYCSECGTCNESCTAEQCGECGDTMHSECEVCGRGNYCCCGCLQCYSCGDKTDNRCEHCCRCPDCCKCLASSSAVWKDVDVSFWPRMKESSIADVLESVDPVQSMADFYLAEWIMTYLPNTATADAAKRIQDGIVASCERAFRLYGPVAIGGELRHHAHGVQGSNRNSSGRCFLALIDSANRGEQDFSAAEVMQDAADIFEDGSWSSGYGGSPWAACAKTFANYYRGIFSPKVFVDRVFSLQHNGGSFLNKMGWAANLFGLDYMRVIGDIHANARTDKDISELVREQYVGGYAACPCSACKRTFTATSMAYASSAMVNLWQEYRAMVVAPSRRAIEDRRAAYYGTVWA